jgi:SAM-dependent methyltransferase
MGDLDGDFDGDVRGDFYGDAELYDLLFPPGARAEFYLALVRRYGGPVLELACGSGQYLVPIARAGFRAVGLDASAAMLDGARRRAAAGGADVALVEGDMRDFDLGERFGLVFVARNSLLHLHATDDLLACLAAVRRHLRPGGALALDVFNPDPALLAQPPGRRAPVMSVAHPTLGRVDAEATSDYDRATQVNRATWYLSAPGRPDFLVAPLHLRSLYPQELRLLLRAAGFSLVAHHGDYDGRPFASGSRQQVCVCVPAAP